LLSFKGKREAVARDRGGLFLAGALLKEDGSLSFYSGSGETQYHRQGMIVPDDELSDERRDLRQEPPA
jgi:hypothetical protein